MKKYFSTISLALICFNLVICASSKTDEEQKADPYIDKKI
jgi:hypothetical protein